MFHRTQHKKYSRLGAGPMNRGTYCLLLLVSLFVGVHGPKIGITINRSPVLLGCHVLQKGWDQPSTLVGIYPWPGSLAPQGNSGMLLQVVDGGGSPRRRWGWARYPENSL